MRSNWATLPDNSLLDQCEVDTYRASGPGGQKRNKTSSAVRLRHLPSGLMVIAEESRSQHENKARALRRLRKAFYLKIRKGVVVHGEAGEMARHPELAPALDADNRPHGSPKNETFWPAVGIILDMLEHYQGRVSDVALSLGTTTGAVVSFLKQDDKVWESVNHIRVRLGQHPLY
ncbi:MAG: peptide chain release factor-like protein [Gemmataceae bacterium]|nr:peptide chain release factor-like protein [Gemmataceae bacterium]